jgi:hypothetical protein
VLRQHPGSAANISAQTRKSWSRRALHVYKDVYACNCDSKSSLSNFPVVSANPAGERRLSRLTGLQVTSCWLELVQV